MLCGQRNPYWSDCSNVRLILVWFMCKCCWTVLLRLLTSISTARFSCSTSSDFWTWFSTQSSLNLGCTADASCTFVSSNTVSSSHILSNLDSRPGSVSIAWTMFEFLKKYCWKVFNTFGLKKYYQYQYQYLLVKVWAIPAPVPNKTA